MKLTFYADFYPGVRSHGAGWERSAHLSFEPYDEDPGEYSIRVVIAAEVDTEEVERLYFQKRAALSNASMFVKGAGEPQP